MSAALLYGGVGFYKTPVTKGIIGTFLLTSCAFHTPFLANYRHLLIYNITEIIHRYKFWRILSAKIAFTDVKDLICCCLLMYYFRVFERRFGSHKFASYLLASFTISTLIEIGIVYALRYFNILQIESLACGPFGLVFPLFVNYVIDVPRVTQTQILGIPITGKSLAYLIGLQTMITSGGTMICTISGIISGIICRWNLFHICDLIKVPKLMASIASKMFSWILESKPPPEGSYQLGATVEIQRQQHIELMEQQMIFSRVRDSSRTDHTQYANMRQNDLNNPQSSASVRNIEHTNVNVNEEYVQTLIEMGFNRQNVIRALQRSNNDANMATVILLSES